MGDKKNMAVASLTLGIVSIVLAWIGYFAFVGLAAAIVGLVLAIKCKKEDPSSIATGGLVTSIIGLCLSGVFLIACASCAGLMACAGVASTI